LDDVLEGMQLWVLIPGEAGMWRAGHSFDVAAAERLRVAGDDALLGTEQTQCFGVRSGSGR
jgi:hypothetical protein